jgi:inorganic pyrophosphatase
MRSDNLNNDIVDAIVEIPYGSKNKYEIDKKTGKIRLDRVLYSAMSYPAEYGTIEYTLAPDGDPLDILILATEKTMPGCIVPCRIIGYLTMIDNGKLDYKLISVVDCDPRYSEINDIKDISMFTLEEIKNFFENYKKLQNIEVIVEDYHNKEEALKILEECRNAYKFKHVI